jgi:hypothetical protein
MCRSVQSVPLYKPFFLHRPNFNGAQSSAASHPPNELVAPSSNAAEAKVQATCPRNQKLKNRTGPTPWYSAFGSEPTICGSLRGDRKEEPKNTGIVRFSKFSLIRSRPIRRRSRVAIGPECANQLSCGYVADANSNNRLSLVELQIRREHLPDSLASFGKDL